MPRLAEFIWALIKIAVIGGVILLGSCAPARTILEQAPTTLPKDWQASRFEPMPAEQTKFLLEQTLYGPVPTENTLTILSRTILDEALFDGKATLIQWRLDIGYGATSRPLDMIALFPNADANAPIILSQNFCPNDGVVPHPGVKAPSGSSFCSDSGAMSSVMKFFFGRYIMTPPLEDIIDRGYAFAAIYPSQFVPDNSRLGLQTLADLFPETKTRPGALSIWASLFKDMALIVEADQGDRPVFAYGHSRFGKTALIAAAWFDEIDGALSHQSGTLGASSLTDDKGEPLSSLVEAYPHWGHPDLSLYADQPSALSVRPADLMHAIKPKPVLLGNARRDVWSDPFGAFTEAKLAFGDEMRAKTPGEFIPADRYAYWLRPGTHGVVKEDWPAFLDFLDAQMARKDEWRPREDLNPQPAD